MSKSSALASVSVVRSDRRGALGALAGGLAVATGIVGSVAASPANGEVVRDKELIAFCDEFCAAFKTWTHMFECDVPEMECADFRAEYMEPPYEAIQVILPSTIRGIAAKARAILLQEYDYPHESGPEIPDEQGRRFVQELAGLGFAS